MKAQQSLVIRATLGTALLLWPLANALAATPLVISNTPLATSSPTQVQPNIFYVLDDSGSMAWDFLPDTVGTDNNYSSTPQLTRNNSYNGVYYDPATTYTPPSKYNSSYSYTTNSGGYPSMNASNAAIAGWTKVPYDGFGVQGAGDPRSTGTNNLFTSSTAGTTQNLTASGVATYYTFTPGEYCQDLSQHTCVAQAASSPSYPYPAYVRWCSSSALTTNTCQVTRFDTAIGGKKYVYARYPGEVTTPANSATATLKFTVGGGGTKTLGGITVNGAQILPSAVTSTTNNSGTFASAVATAINSCTSAATGNCTVAGYSASNSSGTLTITAPSSLGAITYPLTPTPTTGFTFTSTAFSGGVTQIAIPGQYNQVVIQPSNNSYPLPGTTAKAPGRTDCAGTTCTYNEEMTNFANWWAYYRTRMQTMKSAASIAFSGLSTSFRIGYMSLNNNNGTDFLNISGIDAAGTQLSSWFSKFLSAETGGSTATRMALSTAGQYYAGLLKKNNAKVNGVTVNDPMQASCQRNYTILSTDGYWNEGNTNSTSANTSVGSGSYSANPSLVGIVDLSGGNLGDQDAPPAVGLPYSEGSTKTYNTMADVAYYYASNDIRADFTGTQSMVTSTMGLGASGFMQYQSGYAAATSGDYHDATTPGTIAGSGVCNWQASGTTCSWPIPVSNQQTTIDDLWHAAVNGRGTYYSAQNPTAIKNGLNNFLATVTATLGSSAGATVSAPNVTQTNNSEYLTTFMSQNWYGELAKYTIDPTTGIASNYAVWSQSGTVLSAPTTPTTPLLDNTAYTSRNIYTYDVTKNPGSLTSFSWPSLSSTVQSYFQYPAISSLTQLTAVSPSSFTAAQVNSTVQAVGTGGAGGANLVAYLTGDRSNEVPNGGNYAYSSTGNPYYRTRLHVLGDMVDSQPAYVTAPAFSYVDPGYAAFQTSNSSRPSMVYVGANDGMLHGFNGSTGAETFAYIPSMVLPNLYHLADQNYASNHLFFVDGSPTSGDICVANCTSSSAASWKTILVGGLGNGGRGYYALDVTNPATPLLLWEFTYDTTKSGGKYISDQDLGLSYGTPVITKLSDGTWVVLVSSGYNNISPGSGHGIVWVLNANTGAIIKKIDTGVGSTTSPSGLAQIGAYVLNGATNNTASRVYGGDLNGNLWRIDISGLTATAGTVTTQLLATLADANGNAQPITTVPVTGNSAGNLLVFVGTGQLLSVGDLSTSLPQSVYAIKDTLAVTASPLVTPVYANPHNNTCASGTSTNCFVKNTLTDTVTSTSGIRTASSSVSVNLGTMAGWFADLPETGERINTAMNLQLGILLFTSNIPGAGSTCSAGGSSYLNYVNFKTGLAIPGQSNVGSELFTANGATALANSSTVTMGSSGQVIANTTTASGGIVVTNLGQTGSTKGTRRISWRELMTN